jgi:hypothetical protein
VLGGDLLIPTVPSFGDFSAGCANGCIVTNQALGGYAARVDVQFGSGASLLWIIASKYDTAPRGNLQGFDLLTLRLWPAPVSPETQVLIDLAVCPNGSVIVADQTTATNGLRVYDDLTEQTTAAMPIGLRPGSPHGLACYQ